jgi:hypothetical protein
MEPSSSRARARKQFLFAVSLLVVAVAGYLVTRSYMPQDVAPSNATSTEATSTQPSATTTPESVSPPAVGEQTLEGEYVCLPHRDTGGPQTLECALGLKADDGNHYALSTQSAPNWSSIATTPTGTRIRVAGHVVSAMALSSDQWQKYDIVGVMQVASFQVI